MAPKGCDDYIRRGRTIIRQHGWMIQGVLPDERQPSYGYTVGLSTSFQHPEIILVGFHPDQARELLNIAGAHVRDGLRFYRACLCDLIIESFPAAFRPIERRSVIKHCNAGCQILGQSFDGVQMFLPDAEGCFPWDFGCEETYARIQTSLLSLVGDPPSPDDRVPPRQ